MYSVFCALAVVFVISVVPETKGRDLDDIAKLFVKNSQMSSMDGKQHSTVAHVINESNGGIQNLAFNGMSEHDSEVTKI